MFPRTLSRLICLLLITGISAFAAELVANPATRPAPTIERDAKGIVTIRSVEPSDLLTYTLEGTTANDKSGRYLAPIDLSHGGIVNAVALSADRLQTSEVVHARFLPLPGLVPLPSPFQPVTQERSFPVYDWAKRHAAVSATVAKQQPAVLFIGDSITHRMERDSVWKDRYEPLNAVNLGFGWDRVENVLWRIENGELADAKPKVAVVLIGTNNLEKDSEVEIAAGIQNLTARLHQKLPDTRILLLGVFPRTKPANANARITAINQLLATLDGRNGITFLDIGSQFLQPDGSISPEIMGDGLHPSPKGYQIWANAMAPKLKELLDAKN